MGKVESLQEQVQALSRDEFAQFRAWLLDRDWAAWDAQLEEDVQAGRLDSLAEQALRDHASGKTTTLRDIMHRPVSGHVTANCRQRSATWLTGPTNG